MDEAPPPYQGAASIRLPWGRGASRLVAVATDVGAWRVISPVLRELVRRGRPYRLMLAEPAASIARQDGVEHVLLSAATADERVDAVLSAAPTALVLGTSVQPVVERAIVRRGAGIPMLAVLDAMLFVERRFGAGLVELPDLVACPDETTAERLRAAGAPEPSLAVTGNPTLEEIWLGWNNRTPPAPHSHPARGRCAARPSAAPTSSASPPPRVGAERGGTVLPPLRADTGGRGGAVAPTDVLFVSSPVAAMRLRGAVFAIDEGEALEDVLAALADLSEHAPGGYRVRVRLHPVQRPERLPAPPAGITLVSDDDPDRLRSCAYARVVVGLSSTLLGEARFLARPSLAYLPGPFWEQERVFAPEYGVRLARSRDQLRAMLAQALREPPDPPPLAGHLGAAGRIADLLSSLA